jgi:hypothetical protein
LKDLGPHSVPIGLGAKHLPTRFDKIIIPNLGQVEYEEKSYMGFGLPKLDFLFVPYVVRLYFFPFLPFPLFVLWGLPFSSFELSL